MEEEQEEVEDVVEVGEIEDEEVSAPPHPAQAAAHHDGQDHNESDSSRVCCAPNSAKDSYIMKFCCQELTLTNSNSTEKIKIQCAISLLKDQQLKITSKTNTISIKSLTRMNVHQSQQQLVINNQQ